MSQPLTSDEIRNRVKEVQKVRFGTIKNHPRNPRKHGDNQRQAFRGSVRELGFVSVPLAYYSDRYSEKGIKQLVWADGHLRGSETAEYTGDVAILDIDDAEADKLLLYADPIAAMAEYESQQLDGLLKAVNSDNEALQAMLAGLAANNGLYESIDPNAEWQGMPAFQQADLTSFRSIHVHFKTQEDIDAFAELIGQEIGEKTRSLWYPEAEKIDMTDIYVSE